MKSFEELYPFESNYLNLDGHRYHYLDEGEGPVLLMLHGNPTWSFYYRDLVLAMRDRYRVIVPDHMGCGFSDKPQDYEYRLATHMGNVQRLLDELDIESYSLVCHDWGGPIGFGVAEQHPERVESLVVFNTTCQVTCRYPWRILMCKLPLIGRAAIRGANLFALGGIVMGSKNSERMTPHVRAGYLKPYDSYEHRIANLRFVEDIPLGPAHPSWETAKEVERQLDRLKAKPMLVCWGKKDFCFDDFFLAQWQRDFPGADFHVFPDAGHYVVEDASDEIIPLMRNFLSRHTSV